MPLYRAGGGGAGLPEGGAPGQILGKTSEGETVWIDPVTSVFRGEWSPDELVWGGSFATGIQSPFSARIEGAASVQPATSAVVPPGQPYTNSVYCKVTNTAAANRSVLTLNVAALAIPNLTRVRLWHKSFDAFSTFESYVDTKVFADNVQAYTYNPGSAGTPWVEAYVAIPANTAKLEFMAAGSALVTSTEAGVYFTGIQLFATDRPYMLGEFVTYAGEMWKSLIDFNSQTPSKTATAWQRAVTLPPPSGTTAQRPAASAAGVGYEYFDTTLGKPIWSKGTGWIDSTGATV